VTYHDLTCTELSAGMRRGDFSPGEVVRSFLDRIAATEPSVEAWELIDAERAMATATLLTKRRGERLDRGPLFGVPIGVKDVFDVEGLPTSANFRPYRDRIATSDAGLVAALKRAGAIVLGKTVTVQFATALDSPKTRNPWKFSQTPGGSSSGSAAAVAARQVPAATGTQTGGSILRPAAYCGVVGLKPTFGRLSRYGLVPVSWSVDHPGYITRSVADAALLLEATADHDPRDPFSSFVARENFIVAATKPRSRPRLGVVLDLLEQSDADVRAKTEAALADLERSGAELQEIRLPASMEQLLGTHYIIRASESAAVHANQYASLAEQYEPNLQANIEVGQLLPSWVYVHSLRLRRRLRGPMNDLFSGLDALVGPTASNVAPDRDTGTGTPSFQIIWSLFGVPNITVPIALGETGMPMGLQVIVPQYREARMFGIAAWVETVFGPLPSPLPN
jgi:aspartyl-tRNA(Asn)/glutamyl-tRNA(Gln) amidotransferase subunit A